MVYARVIIYECLPGANGLAQMAILQFQKRSKIIVVIALCETQMTRQVERIAAISGDNEMPRDVLDDVIIGALLFVTNPFSVFGNGAWIHASRD